MICDVLRVVRYVSHLVVDLRQVGRRSRAVGRTCDSGDGICIRFDSRIECNVCACQCGLVRNIVCTAVTHADITFVVNGSVADYARKLADDDGIVISRTCTYINETTVHIIGIIVIVTYADGVVCIGNRVSTERDGVVCCDRGECTDRRTVGNDVTVCTDGSQTADRRGVASVSTCHRTVCGGHIFCCFCIIAYSSSIRTVGIGVTSDRNSRGRVARIFAVYDGRRSDCVKTDRNRTVSAYTRATDGNRMISFCSRTVSDRDRRITVCGRFCVAASVIDFDIRVFYVYIGDRFIYFCFRICIADTIACECRCAVGFGRERIVYIGLVGFCFDLTVRCRIGVSRTVGYVDDLSLCILATDADGVFYIGNRTTAERDGIRCRCLSGTAECYCICCRCFSGTAECYCRTRRCIRTTDRNST